MAPPMWSKFLPTMWTQMASRGGQLGRTKPAEEAVRGNQEGRKVSRNQESWIVRGMSDWWDWPKRAVRHPSRGYRLERV